MPESPTLPEPAGEEATIELRLLERSAENVGGTDENPFGLQPDPIPREWILDGTPVARRTLLAGSSDHMASTHMWDCTAGRFSWYYGSDETVYVLEGSVVIEDAAGVRRRLGAGDTFLFPAGSRFHWTVASYVRKLAFLHAPLSRKMRLVKGFYDFLRSPFKRKQRTTAWTG